MSKKKKQIPTMTVPPGVFHIVQAAAKEIARHAIDGVRFCREKTRNTAVATDGRMLVELSWPLGQETGPFPAAILDRESCTHFAAVKVPVTVRMPGDGSVELQPGQKGIRYSTTFLKGKFPDYQGPKVIPDYTPSQASTFTVDLRLLARLLKIIESTMKHTEGKCTAEVTIPNDRTRPIVVRTKHEPGCDTGIEALGVLMQVKT
jgi:hypothetical protein